MCLTRWRERVFLANRSLGGLGATPGHLQAGTCQIEVMSHMSHGLGRIESYVPPADTTEGKLLTSYRDHLMV